MLVSSNIGAYLPNRLPDYTQTRPLQQIDQHDEEDDVHDRSNGLVEEELHQEVAHARRRRRGVSCRAPFVRRCCRAGGFVFDHHRDGIRVVVIVIVISRDRDHDRMIVDPR